MLLRRKVRTCCSDFLYVYTYIKLRQHMKVHDQVAKSFMSFQADFGTFDGNSTPTYLVFEPIFGFSYEHGLLADEQYVNSALAYLKRNNLTTEYGALKIAIQRLRDLVYESPWTFHKLSGFSDVLSQSMSEPQIVDKTLRFSMLEAVDLRVSKCLELFKTALFNKRGRWIEVLPRNLQEFSVSVLIHEFRTFSERIDYDINYNVDIENIGTDTFAQFRRSAQNENVNPLDMDHYLLHFGKCRFTTNTGATLLSDDWSNEDVQERHTNIEIAFSAFAQTHNFNTIIGNNVQTDMTPSGSNDVYPDDAVGPLGGRFDNTITTVKSKLDNIKTRAENIVDFQKQKERLLNIAEGAIDRLDASVAATIDATVTGTLDLGNVYANDIASYLSLLENDSFDIIRNNNIFK